MIRGASRAWADDTRAPMDDTRALMDDTGQGCSARVGITSTAKAGNTAATQKARA